MFRRFTTVPVNVPVGSDVGEIFGHIAVDVDPICSREASVGIGPILLGIATFKLSLKGDIDLVGQLPNPPRSNLKLDQLSQPSSVPFGVLQNPNRKMLSLLPAVSCHDLPEVFLVLPKQPRTVP